MKLSPKPQEILQRCSERHAGNSQGVSDQLRLLVVSIAPLAICLALLATLASEMSVSNVWIDY